tara:strand:- start:10368 stop:10979 length:612 start_codon:yes stop_codon:yes gene_type:complete
MIGLVIFDLDGVLVDACEWHRVALNLALKEICNYEISPADHDANFNGMPTRVKLHKLTERGVLREELHSKIYKRKQELTTETINKKSAYRKEKVEMIKELKRHNIATACYTNSIRETALLMLETAGVLEHLDAVLTNQDVKNSKPDPEGYNRLVRDFGVEKNKVLIVEDSPIGIAAARASGCKVIEVTNAEDVNFDLLKEYVL